MKTELLLILSLVSLIIVAGCSIKLKIICNEPLATTNIGQEIYEDGEDGDILILTYHPLAYEEIRVMEGLDIPLPDWYKIKEPYVSKAFLISKITNNSSTIIYDIRANKLNTECYISGR